MEVEVRIDSSCREPRVVIVTDRMTEEVEALRRQLESGERKWITGFREGTVSILEPEELIRVYAASQKVYAVTERGEFLLRRRLYEMEQILDRTRFVRISHSEIIQLSKVQEFDISLAGTIRVRFLNGDATYVSRRYLRQIKEILGL